MLPKNETVQNKLFAKRTVVLAETKFLYRFWDINFDGFQAGVCKQLFVLQYIAVFNCINLLEKFLQYNYLWEMFSNTIIYCKPAIILQYVFQNPWFQVLLKACESLYRFGEKSEENRVQIMNFGALEPLFTLVKSEDKAVHRNAMMAFGILSCQVNTI